jgi:hypothetical protein
MSTDAGSSLFPGGKGSTSREVDPFPARKLVLPQEVEKFWEKKCLLTQEVESPGQVKRLLPREVFISGARKSASTAVEAPSAAREKFTSPRSFYFRRQVDPLPEEVNARTPVVQGNLTPDNHALKLLHPLSRQLGCRNATVSPSFLANGRPAGGFKSRRRHSQGS